jgi:hypothetical protein
MPGTPPERRRRRLAPVPCASRLRALISIFILLLLGFPRFRDQTTAGLMKASESSYSINSELTESSV